MSFGAIWPIRICLKGRKTGTRASGESQTVDVQGQTHKKSKKDKCDYKTYGELCVYGLGALVAIGYGVGEKEGGLPENLQEWLTYQQKLTEQSNMDLVMLLDSAELIARGLPAKKLPAWWASGCVTENSPFSPDSEITACQGRVKAKSSILRPKTL